MIDVHSHILPQMDDGSTSVQQSIEMLEESALQGVDIIAATPHYYPEDEYPDEFLERRETSRIALAKAVSQSGKKLPPVITGAEVAFFDGISRSEQMRKLCYSGTNIILVEMPCATWSKSVVKEILDMPYTLDLVPVIAHIDRYMMYQKRELVKQLVKEGVIIQANASFFLRKDSSDKAVKMLKKGLIHLLGSDCHNMTSRPPNISGAAEVIKSRLGIAGLEYLRESERNVFGL